MKKAPESAGPASGLCGCWRCLRGTSGRGQGLASINHGALAQPPAFLKEEHTQVRTTQASTAKRDYVHREPRAYVLTHLRKRAQ